MGGIFHSAVFQKDLFQTDDNCRVINELVELHEGTLSVKGIVRVIDELVELHEDPARLKNIAKSIDELVEIHETNNHTFYIASLLSICLWAGSLRYGFLSRIVLEYRQPDR